ncbi:hypothetical protein EG328_008970 [Venturia inaequalis]|uniref:Alpha-ketoglutarate-dependent dioxygenase AlkB-like domain-containing protein n=1 Tax=Venturia inaequalis TaxID=5025 RepID=A0A8H3Z3U7_VENIN|nr:hypothetical protein EG328_008970 [Venturia inaequalis]
MEHSSGRKHDVHAIPPQAICDLYRHYQKLDNALIDADVNIVDFRRGLTPEQQERIVPVDTVSAETLVAAERAFRTAHGADGAVKDAVLPCTIYEHKDFQGLRLLPSLLPPECQLLMLDSIMHRDLSNPLHTINLTQDYHIPYPPTSPSGQRASFFTYPQFHPSGSQVLQALNPLSANKPLNAAQFLQKKLRWLTLGDQYNWSTRSYPTESPTPFPSDIAALVTTLFNKAFVPESGVVLLYSPKDYMPVHRDVSEQCEHKLASFTLGCDGLFVISRDKEPYTSDGEEQEMVVIRVRSGDVVEMGGETRWAWHAMPKVMANTCPSFMQHWPAEQGKGTRREYEKWKGVSGTAENRNITAAPLGNATALALAIQADQFPRVSISGNQTLVGWFCRPTIVNENNQKLQVLLGSITTNREAYTAQGGTGLYGFPSYEAELYSWVRYAGGKGYPTLSMDRLGAGKSSHPDPSAVVQGAYEYALYHDLAQQIRKGTTGSLDCKYSTLIYIGNSYGSVTGNNLAARYPGDFEAFVLTGFSKSILPSLPGIALQNVMPASTVWPARYANLSGAYLTSPSTSTRTDSFFGDPEFVDFDPAVAQLYWEREDDVSTGQFVKIKKKATSALSNLIGGDQDSNPQDAETPVESASGDTKAQPVSAKHSRYDSKFDDFAPQDPLSKDAEPKDAEPKDAEPKDAEPKDAEPKDDSEVSKPQEVAKPSESLSDHVVPQSPTHKDDTEQEDGSHAIGAVPAESASSDAQPKADDLKLEEFNEKDSKPSETQPVEIASSSPTHKDDVEQEDGSHAIGVVPDESASSEAQPKDDEPSLEVSTENSEKSKAEPAEHDGKTSDVEPPESKTTPEVDDKPEVSEGAESKDEPEAKDQAPSQKVEDKEDDISPKDVDGLKDDGKSSADAQPSIETSEKPETEDSKKDVTSTDTTSLTKSEDVESAQSDPKDLIVSQDEPEEKGEPSEAEAKGEPNVEEEPKAKKEGDGEPESKDGESVEKESQELESKAEESINEPEAKEEPQPKDESVPENDSKDGPEDQSEKVNDKEDDVSPKDLGELQDDGDAAASSQPTGDEDVQPPKRSSVHFDGDTKAPADDDEPKENDTESPAKEVQSPEPQSDQPESKENDTETPAKELQSPETQAEQTESKEPEFTEPEFKELESKDVDEKIVDAESQDKFEPEADDAHNDKPEQISKEAEASSPLDASSKNEESEQAAGKEDASSPKADTDAATATETPAIDESLEGEAKDDKASESDQANKTPEASVEDTPQTSDIVAPKDIGELEGDGDASANSQPDGTETEPPIITEKSENDANDTTGAPTEEDAKRDESKDVDAKEAPANPDTLTENEPAKGDDIEPKSDGQEPKQSLGAQDNDVSKDNEPEETPANEDKLAEPTVQESDNSTGATAEDESKPSQVDADNTKDEGNSEIDLPERPKSETNADKPSDGSEEAPKGSLLDGVVPSTVEKAEEKREVEPSHPEAQQSPDIEQDSTTAQIADAPKGSLLDVAEPSHVEEAKKDQTGDDEAPVKSTTNENEVTSKETQSSQPLASKLAPEEEFDDASVPEPTSDHEEVMGDDKEDSKYENQVSSKESSKPSQQKRQKTSTTSDTLTSLTEVIADTRKDLLDTTTKTGKDATGSVSDGIKDNAKETGKTYTESLRRT